MNHFNGRLVHVDVGEEAERQKNAAAYHDYPWQASQYWSMLQPLLWHEPGMREMHRIGTFALHAESSIPGLRLLI